MVDFTNPTTYTPVGAAKQLYFDTLFEDANESPFKYVDEATDYKEKNLILFIM